MEHARHHGIIDPSNSLDREQIIDILDHAGHGFDDDESTIALRQKLMSDIAAGLIPKSVLTH